MMPQMKNKDSKNKDPTFFEDSRCCNHPQVKKMQANEPDSLKNSCYDLLFPPITQNNSICLPMRKNVWIPSGPNIKKEKQRQYYSAYQKETNKQQTQFNSYSDQEKQAGQQAQNFRFHHQEMRPSMRQISPQKKQIKLCSQDLNSAISLTPAANIKEIFQKQEEFYTKECPDSRTHLQPKPKSIKQQEVIKNQSSKNYNLAENSNFRKKSSTNNNSFLDKNAKMPLQSHLKLESIEPQQEFRKSFQQQLSQKEESFKNTDLQQKNNGNMFTRKAAKEFQRINTIRRTRIAFKSLIFLIRFWKITKRNIILKRQVIMCKYSPEYLKLSVESAMDFSQNCMYQELVQLFMEPMSLEYSRDNRSNLSKDSKLKKLRLRKHTWDILEALTINGEKMINSQFPFIDFIESQISSGRYLFNGLFPIFIIQRLQFNSFGRLDSLMASQREMIALFFFLIYGPFNRLVDPWQVMSLDKSLIKAKNAQLVLSCLFYLFRDYISEYCPIRNNALSKTLPNYKPIPRSKPLNSYSSILQHYPLFQETNGTPIIENITKELESQCFLNDNIIIGLYPRNKLEDLISQDEQLRLHCRQCFSKISLFLLTQVKAFEKEHLYQQDSKNEDCKQLLQD